MPSWQFYFMCMLQGLPCERNFCFPSWWCRTPSSLCKGATNHHKYFGEGKLIYVFILFSISEVNSTDMAALVENKQLVSTVPCNNEKYGWQCSYPSAKCHPTVVSEGVKKGTPMQSSWRIFDEYCIENLIHLCWICYHSTPGLCLDIEFPN